MKVMADNNYNYNNINNNIIINNNKQLPGELEIAAAAHALSYLKLRFAECSVFRITVWWTLNTQNQGLVSAKRSESRFTES